MLGKKNDIIPKNYWKLIVFTFCLGWAIIWIYRSMLSPIYEEIQGTIGMQSKAAMGLIASCYFFGYTALQIPSGFLVDKFGQKKVLIPGFLVFALGVLSIAFAGNVQMIYLGAVAAGVGCGTYYGAAFSMTTQYVPPEKKGVSTAIVNSGSALGMIIGMNLSSQLVLAKHLPWQVMPFISAGLIIFLVLWFIFALRPTAQPAATQVEKSTKTTTATTTADAGAPIFSMQMIACYILYFTTCYAYYLIVTWLPDFLKEERGIAGGMVGLVVSMIAVTAVPGALLFARLSDKKRNEKDKIIIGLEVAAFILIGVSMFAPGARSLAVILLLYGLLGKLAVDPVLISYVSDKASKNKLATTLGVFNFFGMSSSVIAPALTGYIMDKTGSGVWGFYLGAILLIVGTILFAIFNRSGKKAVA